MRTQVKGVSEVVVVQRLLGMLDEVAPAAAATSVADTHLVAS